MKINLTIIISLIIMSFSVFGNDSSKNKAGATAAFAVEHVRVDRNGLGFVKFVDELTGTPASCRTKPYKNMLSFDTNTAGGKAIYSMVLSAYLSGKNITAVGTGTCDDYNNLMESWGWGAIVD